VGDASETARDDTGEDGLDRFLGALTLRRALGAGVVTLALIVALSIAVGFVAGGGDGTTAHVETEDGATVTVEQPGHDSFEWEVASIFGTAVGTTLLALATGFLAIGTWRDVRASQSMVELTRKEQNERIRPVVVGGVVSAVVSGTSGGAVDHVTVKVGLTNVGGGPAVRVEVMVIWTKSGFGDAGPLRADAQVIRAIRPGQDVDDIVFTMEGALRVDDFKSEELHVVGSYRDRLGNPAGSILDWTKSVTIEAPPAESLAKPAAPTIPTEIDEGPQVF
jgi:hypothetical protein